MVTLYSYIAIILLCIFSFILYSCSRHYLGLIMARVGLMRSRGGIPNLTMEEAWNHWTNQTNWSDPNAKLHDENIKILKAVFEKADAKGISEIRDELFETEAKANRTMFPLIEIRKAMMDLKDTCSDLETFCALDEKHRSAHPLSDMVNESPDGVGKLAGIYLTTSLELNIIG